MYKIIGNTSEHLIKDCKNKDINSVEDLVDKYYHLYEFSDEIFVIENEVSYPSIYNYVEQGLISEDELKRLLNDNVVLCQDLVHIKMRGSAS